MSNNGFAAEIITDEQAISAGISPALYVGPPGITFRGEYDDETAYVYRDGVTYNHGYYIVTALPEGAAALTAGTEPTNAEYWTPVLDPSDMLDAEAARVEAESGRASAESNRVSAEQGRTSAEESRVSVEAARVEAESGRASAESGRASAETNRATAEQGRTSAEESRVSVEAARVTAEQGRATAEQGRTSAEESRVSVEAARVTAEQGRASAEESRTSAEESRVSVEAARVTAEQGRASAEESRTSAEESRVSAEQGRASAEQNRVSAEQERAAAELARASDTAAAIDNCEEATAAANQSVKYLHIRWGETATPATLKTTPDAYIGIANTASATAPTSYTAYQWFQWKGLKGDTGGNEVSTSSETDITGLIKGDGSNVLAAVAGTDFQTPTQNLAASDSIANGDAFPIFKASGSTHRRTLWSTIKATLKAFFDGIYATTANYTATITTAWTGSQAPYTQTIAVAGITAADEPIMDLVPSSTYATADAETKAYGSVYNVVTGNGTITVYSKKALAVALNVKLKVVR